jgi:hypothetical protein
VVAHSQRACVGVVLALITEARFHKKRAFFMCLQNVWQRAEQKLVDLKGQN